MTNKVDLIMSRLDNSGAVRVKMLAESGVRSLKATVLAGGDIALAQHPGATMVRLKAFELRELLEINRMYIEDWS